MPGKHMSGHMGNESATILNLLVVDVNEEKGYILVRGGIPGARKSIVTIRSAVKDVKNPDKAKKLVVREVAPAAAPVEAPVEAPAEEAKAE
jgi:large subunit ribosomal protein L3